MAELAGVRQEEDLQVVGSDMGTAEGEAEEATKETVAEMVGAMVLPLNSSTPSS